MSKRPAAVLLAALLVLVLDVVAIVRAPGEERLALTGPVGGVVEDAADVPAVTVGLRGVVGEKVAPTTAVPTTVPPPPPTTAAPTTAAPTTAAPPPVATTTTTAPPAPAGRFGIDAYRGLGAWVDVYDWSLAFTNGNPGVLEPQIDRMAALGVRTLYIQASHIRNPELVLEEGRLRVLLDRAHAAGMRVVAWYLPTLVDPGHDLLRLLTIAGLPIDGLAVDIESREVADPAVRNANLVWLSEQLRANLPGEVLSAIVVPPVQMEDVNPNFWPGFPWAQLATSYDVWQPMGYWSQRRAGSGWDDGYNYTAANIDRIRANTGRPDAAVHPVGGIAHEITADQVGRMVQAAAERGALGASVYDFRTTADDLWPVLASING